MDGQLAMPSGPVAQQAKQTPAKGRNRLSKRLVPQPRCQPDAKELVRSLVPAEQKRAVRSGWKWTARATWATVVLVSLGSGVTSALWGLPPVIALPFAVPALLLLGTGVLVGCYWQEQQVGRARRLVRHLRQQKARLAKLQSELEASTRQEEEIRSGHERLRQQLREHRGRLQQAGQREVRLVETAYRKTMELVTRRRHRLNEQGVRALKLTSHQMKSYTAEYNQRMAELADAARAAASTELEACQQQFLLEFLKRHTVSESKLPGIGKAYKERLQRAGVRTAADVEPERVQAIEGFGRRRAETVVRWREELEQLAQEQCPDKLSLREIGRLKARFENYRKRLESEKYQHQLRVATQEKAIKARFRAARDQIDQGADKVRQQLQAKLEAIKQNCLQSYQQSAQPLLTSAKQAKGDYQAIAQKTADLRQKVDTCNAQLAALNQEVANTHPVEFAEFLRQTFWF